MKNSRRDFLKKGALAGFSALMIPEIAKAAVKENTSVHAPKINLKKDCVILFQGDSITDCVATGIVTVAIRWNNSVVAMCSLPLRSCWRGSGFAAEDLQSRHQRQ